MADKFNSRKLWALVGGLAVIALALGMGRPIDEIEKVGGIVWKLVGIYISGQSLVDAVKNGNGKVPEK